MVVNIDQIKSAVVTYIEQELAAKATGLNKFLLYGASYIAQEQAQMIFQTAMNHPAAKMSGIIKEDGTMDADLLYNSAKYASQKTGKVLFAGFMFSEDDVEIFYNILKKIK